MGFGSYYNVGLRIGAEDTRMPIDPYADPLSSKPAISAGAGPSWWTLDQYRAKAKAWWDSTTQTTPTIIEIKSNGAKLHSLPFDNAAEALAGLEKAMATPADYAYIAYFKPENEAPYFVPTIPNLVNDRMFVPVTPIVHETTKTILSTYTPPSSHAVAAGMGILGAIGLLALAAKAR